MKKLIILLGIIFSFILGLILIFIAAKIFLPEIFPSFKIYPSDSAILKNTDKYNYCMVDGNCDVFVYRDACVYKSIPVNKENMDKMLQESRKWVYSGTNGDCPAYRPGFFSSCVQGKCTASRN
jgi:hypothetical protein